MAHDPRVTTPLVPGNPVAVRVRFDGTWSEGFRVCREHDGRYLVERCSDGFELPAEFDFAELRLSTTSSPPYPAQPSPWSN